MPWLDETNFMNQPVLLRTPLLCCSRAFQDPARHQLLRRRLCQARKGQEGRAQARPHSGEGLFGDHEQDAAQASMGCGEL